MIDGAADPDRDETALAEVIVEKAAINVERLHEELASALGDDYAGLSTGGERGAVRVYVRGKVDAEQVRRQVAGHDAAQLSARQQREAGRFAVIERLRAKPWAAWSAQDKEDALRVLVERLLDGA